MAIGNPSIIFNQGMQAATRSPKFSQLSPASQAAIQKLASLPPGSTLREFQTNTPAYQQAIAEGQQLGILDNTPLWQAILKGVAITGGAALAGPAIGALVGSGGGAGATAASMVPGAEGGLAAGATGAGTVAGTAAASTGFGAALKAALPTIIGAGASLGGSAIASHGNTEAAKTQAAAAEKAAQIQADQLDRALAQAKYIYQTQRADQSGYRSSGNNALGALDFGLGLPAPTFDAPPVDPSIANPAPTTGTAPGAVDASGKPLPGAATAPVVTPPTMAQQQTNNRSLGLPGGGGTVRIQDPATGLVHLIPQSDAAAAQQAGGRLV